MINCRFLKDGQCTCRENTVSYLDYPSEAFCNKCTLIYRKRCEDCKNIMTGGTFQGQCLLRGTFTTPCEEWEARDAKNL